MGLLNRIASFIFCRRWVYVFSNSVVRVQRTANVNLGRSVKIHNSKIFVDEDSSLTIKDDAIIENADIYVRGELTIGNNTIIGQNKNVSTIVTIEDGCMSIGHHSKLSCNRVWIRFGGKLSIGDYTNYNAGGEIRVDESVSIGDYGMISYNVNIWDTNTHTIYSKEKRREIARKYWPYFGKELERPKTSSVSIGDDAWIGENASILKGTHVGDCVIIGYGATLIKKTVESGASVVTESNVRYI